MSVYRARNSTCKEGLNEPILLFALLSPISSYLWFLHRDNILPDTVEHWGKEGIRLRGARHIRRTGASSSKLLEINPALAMIPLANVRNIVPSAALADDNLDSNNRLSSSEHLTSTARQFYRIQWDWQVAREYGKNRKFM
ncbi:hypothetical protein RvY_17699 [Ramazzottius varieornatus]|uniref:Uncharacterized protein n=1 Tax=Ramazzottius varieornatus TaxID=947166 RepID=A0A1D1W3A0_RAMVA|nr:hypothetical protein RvY_17699 [Ramazzottius varieornatus]